MKSYEYCYVGKKEGIVYRIRYKVTLSDPLSGKDIISEQTIEKKDAEEALQVVAYITTHDNYTLLSLIKCVFVTAE